MFAAERDIHDFNRRAALELPPQCGDTKLVRQIDCE